MEEDIKKMSVSELEEQIIVLENSYAELLAAWGNSYTLKKIWIRIQELRKELQLRNNSHLNP